MNRDEQRDIDRDASRTDLDLDLDLDSDSDKKGVTRFAQNGKNQTPNPPRPGLPDRCADCGLLAFDCLCDRGPLIRNLGRQ